MFLINELKDFRDSRWVTNAHGLIKGHTPDNLMAYDNDPQFCRRFTKEEYELLYKMLDSHELKSYISLFSQEVLHLNGFDPEKVFEAIRVLPNNATRIGYSFVKKMQALIQQVADEDLPLFIGMKLESVKNDQKILDIILEWRLKCQRK